MLHLLHSLLEKEAGDVLKQLQSLSVFSSLNTFEGNRFSLHSKIEQVTYQSPLAMLEIPKEKPKPTFLMLVMLM